MILNNPMSLPVALVTTQYVEDYGLAQGGSTPYFKFKGGADYIVETNSPATAMGVVLQTIHKEGRGDFEYPLNIDWFSSVEEAKASLPEYTRDRVKTATQTV